MRIPCVQDDSGMLQSPLRLTHSQTGETNVEEILVSMVMGDPVERAQQKEFRVCWRCGFATPGMFPANELYPGASDVVCFMPTLPDSAEGRLLRSGRTRPRAMKFQQRPPSLGNLYRSSFDQFASKRSEELLL